MTAHLRVDKSPFQRLIGLELVRAEDGSAELRLPWRDELGRADGADWFHGGVISALIDIAGDYAIASKLGHAVPTIDLRVDYLRPPGAATSRHSRAPSRSGAPWESPTSSSGTPRRRGCDRPLRLLHDEDVMTERAAASPAP
jgi:uncharacterized protein (TIGR00369 family)